MHCWQCRPRYDARKNTDTYMYCIQTLSYTYSMSHIQCLQTSTGCWFGTCILLFHSVGNNSSSQLTFTPSFFRGVGLNHQPPVSSNRHLKRRPAPRYPIPSKGTFQDLADGASRDTGELPNVACSKGRPWYCMSVSCLSCRAVMSVVIPSNVKHSPEP